MIVFLGKFNIVDALSEATDRCVPGPTWGCHTPGCATATHQPARRGRKGRRARGGEIAHQKGERSKVRGRAFRAIAIAKCTEAPIGSISWTLHTYAAVERG